MRIASKWLKHRVLAEYPSIRKHLPETHLYTNASLWNTIRRHRSVYLKPVVGSGGNGIIRIIRKNESSFLVQKGMNKYPVKSKQSLFRLIRRLTGPKRYLVQQGINMISIQNRPLDYRLLILRPRADWEIIGTMGKWAAPGKIVTNFVRGAKPINLCSSLKRSIGYNNGECANMEERINLLGMGVAKTLGNRYRMRDLGLDIAIDKRGRLWILEVNTGPFYKLFRYHHNRSLYPKIVRYMRMIGR